MIQGNMLRDAIISAANSIANNRKAVDDLNIFPVPDGDTGTNMSMTVGAASKELAHFNIDEVGEVASCAASAMLRGARGNSGVITSLLFRGFAKGLKDKNFATGEDLANAMTLGVEAAYKAVMKPVEGTILTVSRGAAAFAGKKASNSDDAVEVLVDIGKKLGHRQPFIGVGQGLRLFVLDHSSAFLAPATADQADEKDGKGHIDDLAAEGFLPLGFLQEVFQLKQTGFQIRQRDAVRKDLQFPVEAFV